MEMKLSNIRSRLEDQVMAMVSHVTDYTESEV